MPYRSGSAAVLRVDAEPAKEFQLLTALPLKADVMPRIAWPAWGQTEKNSVRDVFRFTLKLGHRSMQSACLKRAQKRKSPLRGGTSCSFRHSGEAIGFLYLRKVLISQPSPLSCLGHAIRWR